MSDYELRQNIRRQDEALRHAGQGGGGIYWIIGAGIVVLVILSLFLFGDAPAPVDGESVAPVVAPTDIAPVTPAE